MSTDFDFNATLDRYREEMIALSIKQENELRIMQGQSSADTDRPGDGQETDDAYHQDGKLYRDRGWHWISSEEARARLVSTMYKFIKISKTD